MKSWGCFCLFYCSNYCKFRSLRNNIGQTRHEDKCFNNDNLKLINNTHIFEPNRAFFGRKPSPSSVNGIAELWLTDPLLELTIDSVLVELGVSKSESYNLMKVHTPRP